MRNITDNSDTLENLWKDFLKYGSAIAGAVWATKRVNNSVVNHHRKDNALEEFENQDLFWRDRQRLKTTFKQHDFYVTKFPDTPREIFPLAVKILYQLIKYHNKSKPDSRLGEKIIAECEELHRIAIKKNNSPINQEWSYWKLVQQEVPKKEFWGRNKVKRQYFTDPSWNLEDFFNEFEGGLIRFGLFGVKEKRIDFCFYRKESWGKLIDRTEVDEKDKTLACVWKVVKHSKYVAEIYDIKFFDLKSELDEELKRLKYQGKTPDPLKDLDDIISLVFKEPNNYNYSRYPNDNQKKEIMFRDAGNLHINNHPVISCRYCKNSSKYGNMKKPLQFHHIWPHVPPRLTKDSIEYLLKKYIITKNDISNLLINLPAGPTETWNMVVVCQKHHPVSNFFTWEGSTRFLGSDEQEQANLFLLEKFIEHKHYKIKKGLKK